MIARDAFNRELSEAVRAMQATAGTQATLEQGVRSATTIIDGCDLAGISIVHAGGIATQAATDEVTRRIDELQYAIGEGPCLTSLREHETVHCPDLAHDERWPQWGAQMSRELGVGSSVSYRLFTTERSLGALNLYSLKVEGFDVDDIHNGLALAAHVAVAVAGAQRATNLERALVNRTVIGQAEGILMERFGLSADQAFAVLARVSQNGNTKLHEVALELVHTRETPGPLEDEVDRGSMPGGPTA